ncbi:MAG: protein translocase subunit SecD [Chitinivibrionales bacterium]|nr:protein translocase subunit SecD [Chitinivibrionales bacterium]
MKRNNAVSLLVIIAAVALSIWFLKDSIMFYSKPLAKRQEYQDANPDIFKRIFNLGLDLQGGMRLVLEIDRSRLTDEEDKDVLDRAYTIIENRINGLGVAEPTIQKQGRDRLIIELPGLKNEDAAKQVIGSTAQLEFKLVRDPSELMRALRIIDNVVSGKEPADSTATDTTADTTALEDEGAREKARQLFEGSEEIEDTAGDTTGGEEILTSFTGLLVQVGEQIGVVKKNQLKVEKILKRKDVREALQRQGMGGSQFLWGHDYQKQGDIELLPLYYVKSRPELKGDAISEANAVLSQGGMNQGQPIVSLEMNRKGARVFSRVTAANVNKYLAIVLDSTVYSAPVIRQKISQGRAQIEGSFTMEEAKNLAIVLQAGALPAPVDIIEERTIGPSLGQDSVRTGIIALCIGFALIVFFMAIYYKMSGLIADFALILNLLFVLAVMAGINATLTLPGIAGLILIIGMAVDANVIIFERIREELIVGKTIRSAVDAGYSRAFLTIMDANITTLITAFILLWIGTGPIKGFAITLIFGIIASLFTALFITKAIFNIIVGSRKLTKLSI